MGSRIPIPGPRIADTYNFMVPCEGAMVIPLTLDFGAFTEYDLDLSQFEQQGRFSMVQSIFVDLSDTASAMSIVVDPNGVNQNIVANGHTQGYYTVLAPNPTQITFACNSAQIEKVHLVNAPVAGVVWAATHP